ncbi:hypothetical protein AOQ84DRAFT_389976 [Glonium stellatum]|uniref:CorA-like transporter domain-containing protein n=1 Tax=Glonium stellatum TaxID=574774 RepID=A0A8E2EXN3_9PEZI|nr:hypothetical protein AOQ84DRAFT_389976 [Glonium stellatum]
MEKLNPKSTDELKNYPFNLSIPSFYVDINRCSDRLSTDAERLFASKKDSQLWTLQFDPIIKEGDKRSVQLIRLKGSTQLTSFLKAVGPTAVFSIRQNFSWSSLQISEDLRQLFASQEVHPNFLDVVHVFGEKTEPVEESFSTFFCHPISQSRTVNLDSFSANDGYEIGYNIKYVTGHGRSFLRDPYSIRDTGVYHKYRRDSTAGEFCCWILIHASDALEERFRHAFQASKETRCVLQFQVHAMVLLSVSENWRGYINYLEESFRKLRERGFLTNIKGPTAEGDIEADFSDIRSLQVLADKLCQLCHILGLNVQFELLLSGFACRILVPTTLHDSYKIMASPSSSKNDVIEQFLEEYADMKAGLKALAEHVGQQCEEKLREADIAAIVTSRQKSEVSLRKKLSTRNEDFNRGEGYKDKNDIFQDISDLAGVRIALYFPNHSERVKEIIATRVGHEPYQIKWLQTV